MRYHLSENEIKPCEAPPGECPIDGGKFYESKEEAENAFAIQNGGTLKSLKKPAVKDEKKYAPEKPIIAEVTIEEAEEAVSRLKDHFLRQKKQKQLKWNEEDRETDEQLERHLPEVLRNPIMGYGLLGSSLFGLEHPDSDRDVLVITSGKGNPVHKIFDDGLDVQVMSLDSIVKGFFKGQPNMVDTVKSDTFQVQEEYRAFANAIRFDSIAYQGRITDHGISDLINARNDIGDPEFHKRALKALKTSVRNFYMFGRVEKDPLSSTTFNAEEREHFYETFTKAGNMLEETRDAEKVLEYVFERATGEKLDTSINWLAEASQTERKMNKLNKENSQE